jgi:putative PIN family toxin of toxin-antitoxin system
MRIVLDTSVLVSASRSRQDARFALVSSLPNPCFDIALSVALYTEWQAVLTRPEHIPPGLLREDVLAYLRYLTSIAHLQDVYYLWRPFLRDPNDDMVLECAVASNSQFLVTHNIHDFQQIDELGVKPITPATFLAFLRSSSS